MATSVLGGGWLTVAEIVRWGKRRGFRYVSLWVHDFGGASYFFTWQIAPPTLVGPVEWTGERETFGEIKRQFRRDNQYELGPIVKAKFYEGLPEFTRR